MNDEASLCQLSSGMHATVSDVVADAELQGRLLGLGLLVGTRFQILRRGTHASNIPFILAIGETRVALDYKIAEMILVKNESLLTMVAKSVN